MQIRVKSEHTIGYLKGRFQSLRGLRQQIKNSQDHEIALAWVRACLTIHNIIISIERVIDESDRFYQEMLADGLTDAPVESEEADGVTAAEDDDEGARSTPGKRFRQKLRRDLLEELEVKGMYTRTSD
jgi:hypothetical protein